MFFFSSTTQISKTFHFLLLKKELFTANTYKPFKLKHFTLLFSQKGIMYVSHKKIFHIKSIIQHDTSDLLMKETNKPYFYVSLILHPLKKRNATFLILVKMTRQNQVQSDVHCDPLEKILKNLNLFQYSSTLLAIPPRNFDKSQ